MKKSLPIIAALLGWTAALAAISGLEAMDAHGDGRVTATEVRHAMVKTP